MDFSISYAIIVYSFFFLRLFFRLMCLKGSIETMLRVYIYIYISEKVVEESRKFLQW